jgi:hypothetical protein
MSEAIGGDHDLDRPEQPRRERCKGEQAENDGGDI